MFNSIYSVLVTPTEFFFMAAAALLAGILYSWLMSFCIRSTQRFYLVVAIVPFVVGSVITFVSGNIGAGVAVGGAFSLIRFRSAPGSADEIAALLIAMGSGIAFGMGYIAYGVIILLILAAIYLLLGKVRLFDHPGIRTEQLLTVTVPETLVYSREFNDIFDRYLESVENVGVKTTNMGAMFKLSFRIRMKNRNEEKAMIDEIRTRNGNLEIAVLPYSDPGNQL